MARWEASYHGVLQGTVEAETEVDARLAARKEWNIPYGRGFHVQRVGYAESKDPTTEYLWLLRSKSKLGYTFQKSAHKEPSKPPGGGYSVDRDRFIKSVEIPDGMKGKDLMQLADWFLTCFGID